MEQQRAGTGRVFILYPAGHRSGGPEALHQLCDALTTMGVAAFLVPLGTEAGPDDTSDYARYRCEYRSAVPDEDDVTVVLPEVAITRARGFARARVVVWWLSIDFAEHNRHATALARGERSLGGRVARVVHVAAPWRPEVSVRAVRRLLPQLSHCAQSQYAVSYLHAREGIVANSLSDYIRGGDLGIGYRDTGQPRAPRSVAYNPAKGESYVRALRELTPELSWYPVQGLDREQVEALLGAVEVYVDLGHHPGKDRIPREAALAGCVVVVARRGAAAFPQDVPIQDALRIEVTEDVDETAERARRTLVSVLRDTEPWRQGQEEYRRQIREQEEVFRREVRRIFVDGELVAPAARR